jgi:transcriptional regulator with XRE-family HTH domain
MDAVPPSSEIGRKLRNIRQARRKSLAVVAGLAGISKSYLSMLELGQRALDRRSVIVALANALEVAPSELTALPVPAPGNGDTDSAVSAVRQALMAVQRDQPGGQVLPADALRARVREVVDVCCACQLKKAGAALPALIRDVHTSIAAGRDVAELLDLAVLLHTRGTHHWLHAVGAPVDLDSVATLAARQAAERLDQPVALGLAVWSDALVMLSAGDFALARNELDSATVPTGSRNGLELAGALALRGSLVAAAEQRPADVEAALGEAAGLAERTGEGNAYWLGFGPTNVAFLRVGVALESGDYARAVAVADGLSPRVHPNRSKLVSHWVEYGRALARIRGRRDDAVLALRRAEKLAPVRVVRDPFVRQALAELLPHAKPNAVGRELRGMAYRAGLPV